jgi:hypothetical protein
MVAIVGKPIKSVTDNNVFDSLVLPKLPWADPIIAHESMVSSDQISTINRELSNDSLKFDFRSEITMGKVATTKEQLSYIKQELDKIFSPKNAILIIDAVSNCVSKMEELWKEKKEWSNNPQIMLQTLDLKSESTQFTDWHIDENNTRPRLQLTLAGATSVIIQHSDKIRKLSIQKVVEICEKFKFLTRKCT